jgi:hypothetical protein
MPKPSTDISNSSLPDISTDELIAPIVFPDPETTMSMLRSNSDDPSNPNCVTRAVDARSKADEMRLPTVPRTIDSSTGDVPLHPPDTPVLLSINATDRPAASEKPKSPEGEIMKLSSTMSESITPNDKSIAVDKYKFREKARVSPPKCNGEKYKLKLGEKASDCVNLPVDLNRSDGENEPLAPNEIDGMKTALAEHDLVKSRRFVTSLKDDSNDDVPSISSERTKSSSRRETPLRLLINAADRPAPSEKLKTPDGEIPKLSDKLPESMSPNDKS